MKNPRKNSLRVFFVQRTLSSFIVTIFTWLACTAVQGATSLVTWGYPTYIPVQPTNVIAAVMNVENSAVILSDHTALLFGGETVDRPLTNVLSVGLGYYNDYILLLTNHTVTNDSPPAGLSNVVAVAESYGGECLALKSDGTVTAWFASPYQQDTFVTNLSNVVSIAAGPTHNLALKNDGTVTAWFPAYFSIVTNVPSGLTNVVAVSAGYNYSLALRRDGTIVLWGTNDYVMTNTPPGLSNVMAIAAGWTHAVALKNDSTVAAWGKNSSGQTNVPPGLTNVIAIAACQANTIAVVDSQPSTGAMATGSTISNGVFSVNVPSLSGRVYSLEYTTNLGTANWTPLPLVAGNGETLMLTDTNLVDQQRFYRVRRW